MAAQRILNAVELYTECPNPTYLSQSRVDEITLDYTMQFKLHTGEIVTVKSNLNFGKD